MNIKMPITRQDYKKFIKYDLITFDMFDTLVSRKIYEPDDILKLVSIKIGNLYCLKPLKFLKSFKKAEK